MESKKINQLATSVSPQTSDLTIIGDPTTGVSKKITLLQIANLFATTGTVSSVAVTETGDALTITGSPITSAGTINIGFAGDATQYVRGDGALADFPTSTGGGSSVSYYLNSSVSQGTIGGVAYRELSKDPISGAGTDITISADGYVASYITDANDPALLEVPAGNFNCEFYFSVNSNAHNPYVYAELYKYDGTTFTLLGSSQSVPEYLTNGTTLSPYYFAIPVAAAALTITDRLAIRIYANVDTRTVTLHTENNHLCQVVTTFSKGLTSLNNLTRQVQFFGTGTSGTDFAITSSTATHTFNLPVASAANTGKLSSTDWSTFNNKQAALTFTAPLVNTSNTISIPAATTLVNGYLASADFTTFNNKQNAITLTTTGTSGAATLIGATLNIPQYADQFVGTVTSVGLSSATSGVTIGSSPITTSGTITLAIATASGSQNGLLSSTDWTTFNSKQATITLTTTGTSGAATFSSNTLNIPQYQAALTNPITGTGTRTLNYLSLFSGTTNSIANSSVYEVFSPEENIGVYVANTLKVQNALVVTGNINAVAATFSSTISATSATLNGNVIINSTAAALSPLQVVATGTILRLGEASGTTGKQLLFGVDSASGRGEIQAVWQGTSNTPLGLNVAGGNVLIGTTTDNGSKLNVSGTATFTQSGGSFLIDSNGQFISKQNLDVATAGGRFTGQSARGTMGTIQIDQATTGADGGTMKFNVCPSGSTTPAEAMRITSGGSVLIASTTSVASSFKLQVGDGSADTRAIIVSSDSYMIGFRKGAGNPVFYDGSDTSGNKIFSNNAGTFIANINQSTGIYTPLSDVNKKKDFEASTIGLNAILGLKPTLYRMTDEYNTNKHLGFIAQEVKEIIPQAFIESEDFIGLNYNAIVAALVKSVQELKAEIDELKNK